MDRKLIVPLVGEAFGTFLFVFIGMASIVLYGVTGGTADLVTIAFAHGITLAVVVTAMAAVSGGHINPAVTIAIWVSGGIRASVAAAYIVAQLVGAAIAGLLAGAVYPGDALTAGGWGRPGLAAGVDPTVGLLLEIVMTAVLLTAVFGTAVDPRAPKLGGLLIGLSVGGDILVGGPLTGAAMNPARWFGPAFASMDFTNALVYIVGPVVGGALVALLYRYALAPDAVLARAD